MEVTIGVSNRHIHLTKEAIEQLFGTGYELTKKKDLKQPFQYACEETVTLKTDKSEMKGVRVLGPARSYTQVELSKTDAYTLGINPPVRESGNVGGSAPITVIGPSGSLELTEGCIIATRHIHATEEDIKRLGLVGVEMVDVKVSGDKGGVLSNVALRATDTSFFEMHIDTDDANAHLIKNGDVGIVMVNNDKA